MFDRRAFLRIGSIAAFGAFSWGDVLRLRAAAPAKEISVIHLWLAGGLSHLDTFDMKMDADRKQRTAFKQIPSSIPGLHVSEHLPRTAKRLNKTTLIRSMTHKQSAHGAAQTLMLSGHDALSTLLVPAVGSVISKELGPRNELPPYVMIPQPRGNNARAGFLGPKYNPFSAGEVNVDKYAVRCGGGANHRTGLFDGVMIKDNHIVAAGGITKAIRSARSHAGHMVHVEIEVDSLEQLDEALDAGANAILLDNMPPEILREAVTRTRGRALLEASGNINARSIAAVAASGVDLISSGAITHSAKCLDVGLDFQQA